MHLVHGHLNRSRNRQLHDAETSIAGILKRFLVHTISCSQYHARGPSPGKIGGVTLIAQAIHPFSCHWQYIRTIGLM